MNENKKEYDCKTCPYITYKDGLIYFCNNCVRKILDEQDKRKEKDNGR